MLATSAAHVVVTSHVARAESFTPLLVTVLLFSVERALNGRNGRWLLVNNDTEKGRHSLAVHVSEDEGRTWPLVRRPFLNVAPVIACT